MNRPSSEPIAPLSIRPRCPLRRKLVVWSFALVLLPTLVCAVWLNGMARQALADNHARNVLMMTHALAAALSEHTTRDWTGTTPHAVEVLDADPRLAFVIVTNADGRVLHRRAADAAAWQAYEVMISQRRGWGDQSQAIDVNVPTRLTQAGDVVFCKAAIWRTPADAAAEPALAGYLVLALTDTSMPDTLMRLRVTQLLAACLVALLCVPLSVIAVRRLTAPVLALVNAAVQFDGEHGATPVHVKTDDEIQLLADAFNLMMRRLAEAHWQLVRANNELEEKVADRTEQLEQTKRDLETQVHDKDEFLRAVSHDLGAPLRNIDGLATMLLLKYRETLTDDAQGKLERISVNVKNQIDLINDLLELSRIRTQPGRRKRVDLNEVIAELRDSLSYDLERRRIGFHVQGPLPIVLAERNRMRQLFQNLLDNAVKYMPADGGSITVRSRTTDTAFELSVQDTGCGIAAEDLTRVFEVFRRCNRAGPTDVPGRGVGLATVKSIVESNGGRVWVESELGRGSTFHVTLDRSIVDPSLAEAEPAPVTG
jgi:signal transduction histidine kinase